MEVKVSHSGLRMTLVSRESLGLLADEWRVRGVYFLLGPSSDPDHYCAYVGEVGKATLIQRLRNHAAKKDWWNRALLIASASDEFNSAEIGWLEGRLYDVLNNALACEVKNGNRPGDDSLSLGERAVLERYVEPIMAALRALGASLDTADQKPPDRKQRAPKRYSESVSDLIAAGLLKPETILHPLRNGVTETARVLSDGRLAVAGAFYDSPSAAAKVAAGTNSEPGWDFWGAPSGSGNFVPLTQLRARLRNERPPAPPKPVAPSEPKKFDQPPKNEAVEDAAPRSPASDSTLSKIVSEHPSLFPLAIFADYRGAHLEAVIETDGIIRIGSETFTSPSTAAASARRASGYLGAGKAQTNGWTFWRFNGDDGATRLLDELR